MGFPVVDVKASLKDGGFHPVDSSAIAFEIAARAAFKEGAGKAKPIVMEPIMKAGDGDGSLNVPIEHHPTNKGINGLFYGYYKVMSNSPKMGHLPTPDGGEREMGWWWVDGGVLLWHITVRHG